MKPIPSYAEWPADEDSRRYLAEDVLGLTLREQMQAQLKGLRSKYREIAPGLSEEQCDKLAFEAGRSALYAMMMVLDGITSNRIDAEHGVQYALVARVRHFGGEFRKVPVEGTDIVLTSAASSKTETVEEIEIVPSGDGLCYAIHGWFED